MCPKLADKNQEKSEKIPKSRKFCTNSEKKNSFLSTALERILFGPFLLFFEAFDSFFFFFMCRSFVFFSIPLLEMC
jgi:hypothetical protein